MNESDFHQLSPLLRQLIREEIDASLFRNSMNLAVGLHERSRATTVEYVARNMEDATSVGSRLELLGLTLPQVSVADGLYLEFGVFTGHTINYIASQTVATVHGFDSFEGLPERWRSGFEAGMFRVNDLPAVPANVELIKGWFDATLPTFLAQKSGPIAFLHVDCDLYSSTKTIFDLLGDRIVAGTIIVFDEYFNYPGWENGEYKAFQEFVARGNVTYRYLGYNCLEAQAAVRIESVHPQKSRGLFRKNKKPRP